MSGKYRNKIGLISMLGSVPKKNICITTEIKLVCFRCGVCFFGFVWFVLVFGGLCVGVVMFWLCCFLFLFNALGWNFMLTYRRHTWCRVLNRVVVSLLYSLSVFLLCFLSGIVVHMALWKEGSKKWSGCKKIILFLAYWLGFPYG